MKNTKKLIVLSLAVMLVLSCGVASATSGQIVGAEAGATFSLTSTIPIKTDTDHDDDGGVLDHSTENAGGAMAWILIGSMIGLAAIQMFVGKARENSKKKK
ncbi:hypothetical protein LJC42_04385 [Eubacteriales bacterium OttesenSCG-928-K08]|nr:hypothetical protein [Eubacteriales bacterium OttesenSCG-928-K08]